MGRGGRWGANWGENSAAMGRWAEEFQFFNHCKNQIVNQVGIEFILVRIIFVGKQNSRNTKPIKIIFKVRFVRIIKIYHWRGEGGDKNNFFGTYLKT